MLLLDYLQNHTKYDSLEKFYKTNDLFHSNNGLSIVRIPYPPTEENCMLSGLCFETDTQLIVAKGLASPLSFDPTTSPTKMSMVSVRIQNANIGSVVHVWFYNNQWNVSTKNHLDATSVNWHNLNLGEKCLDSLNLELLNPSYCYTIFIPDYLVLATVDVMHIGSVDLKTMKDVDDHSIELPKPKWLNDFHNWDDLIDYVDELPISCPGVLLYNLETSYQYFMRNEKFDEIEKMLGNNRDIEYRCIVLNHLGKRKIAEQIFPVLVDTFREIEQSLREIAKVVYDCYVKRFIKKTSKLIVHPEIHTIMQHMHKEFLERRRAGSYVRVTEAMVDARIWIYSPRGIAKLLRLSRNPDAKLLIVHDTFESDEMYKTLLDEFAKLSAKPERKRQYRKRR
jgi:hypothetical protein